MHEMEAWVGNEQEAVAFNVHITQPTTWYSQPRLYRCALEGTIDLTGHNLHLLFGSLFLLEQVIDFEDASSD